MNWVYETLALYVDRNQTDQFYMDRFRIELIIIVLGLLLIYVAFHTGYILPVQHVHQSNHE